MEYKILFTDLDGTLLDNKSNITALCKEAAASAFAAGKQVVLCSGRTWKSLDSFEKELGIHGKNRYGIAFNGGLVYETSGKKILFSQPMENSVGVSVVNELKKLDADILMYAGETLYAEHETEMNAGYSRHVNIPIQYIPDLTEIKSEIMKIIVKGEYSHLSNIEKITAPLFAGKCNVFFSSSTLIEYAHLNTHKGAGLKFLCGHLNIPIEESIAMGDQANDIEMLAEAGLGIAVSNAPDDVKAAADVVLPISNDEEAFHYVVNEWLLK